MDDTWSSFLRDIEQVRSVAPSLAGLTVRADEGDGDDRGRVLHGHFARFNVWYEIDSWFEGRFLERIAPGAFKRTFNAARSANDPHRIQVLLEHGFDPTVGDKPLGVWDVLEEDSDGARYEVPLFDATYVRDLEPAFEAGAYGASFRFRVMHDEWVEEPDPSDANPDGLPERTIKEVRTFEFGPTVFPASPTATAGLRSDTDEFYERLRSREPKTYEQLLARAREIRTPDDGPGQPATSSDGPASSKPTDSPEGTRRTPTPSPEQLLEAINLRRGSR